MAADLSPADSKLIKRELAAWAKEPREVGATYQMHQWSEHFIARLLTAARAEGAAGSVGDITTDGPYPPSDSRRWLARKLLDGRLSDEEAFEIVSFHPCIKAPLRTEEPPVGGGEG